MSALLDATGLACRRGGRLVLAGVDLALEPGGALLLTGPNGSGKSSLLRLLAGYLAPAAGRLLWQGAPALDDPALWRTRLHHVGQADGIKGVLTVAETLRFWRDLLGGAGDPLRALATFDLEALADWPGRLLSTGQRRRLALARLLVAGRPLWLLDEPETGLDAPSRARLEGVIRAHRAAGGLAVIATHGGLALEHATTLDLGRPQGA
jgi:heme exporter protein A